MSASLLDALSAAYHGDKQTRTAATEQLSQLMQSPEAPMYLVQLIDAGVNPALPLDQSLSALLFAKNSLLYTIPDQLMEQHRNLLEQVEEKLFHGMFVVPESHRKIIKECIATLISGFNWNYLPELIPMVTRITEHAAHGGAAGLPPLENAKALIQLLYTYLKRFKTPNLVPASVRMKVLQALVDVVPLYATLYQDFFLTRLTFKVMECLIEAALRLDTAAERKQLKGPIFDAWYQLMGQFLETYLAPSPSAGSGDADVALNVPRSPTTGAVEPHFILCVKRIAMITYSIMNDATRRKKPVPVATHFIKSSAAKSFLILWERWLRFCIATTGRRTGAPAGAVDRHVFMKSEMFAIRFIKLCTLDQALYCNDILPQAIPLMERLFLPYLFYNEEDEEVFANEEDLPEYTQYMMNESVGMGELSPRQAASNAILSFIGGKKPFHAGPQLLHPLLQALNGELSLDNSPASMPRVFGALHLLSILRKHLRADISIWSQQMHAVLAQYVAPRMAADMPLTAVRCKAITVCQRYAKVPMPSEEVFASFVHLMCQCLHDTDPRIRLSGIDAVCTLLEMKRARPYLAPFLVPVVEQCMEFLNKVQTTFIPTVILHVATHFAPEIASVMDRLGSALVQQFLATAFDLESMEDFMTGEDGNTNAMQQYEAAAFSADSLLRAIDTVLSACENNLPAVEKLRPDLVRLIQQVLPHPNAFEYMEQTLVIFLHLVHFTNPITQDLWDLLPLLFQTVEQGSGIDVFNTIEEVLDNFISGAPAAYMQSTQLMDLTLQCCEKMLMGGVSTTNECIIGAPQLIEALVHQAKGPAAPPGLLNPYLPRILNLLLQSVMHSAVNSAEDVPLRIWILAAIMDCFYYDAGMCLQTLVELNAAAPFFQGLFHFFRGAIPQIQAPQSQAAAGLQGKKKKKKAVFDESAEVLEALSILTRKVLLLGLSSLLAYAADAQRGAAGAVAPSVAAFLPVFMAEYAPLAITLSEYCVVQNNALYVKRCAIAKTSIERLERGDDEDDVEDVDPDDEAILGIDGGDDTEQGVQQEDPNADMTEYELMAGAEDVQSDDDAASLENSDHQDDADMFGFEADEGDDYESPIDDINEVEFFAHHWLLKAAAAGIGAGVSGSEAAYQAYAEVAGEYRRLCVQLDALMKKSFTERKENFDQVSGQQLSWIVETTIFLYIYILKNNNNNNHNHHHHSWDTIIIMFVSAMLGANETNERGREGGEKPTTPTIQPFIAHDKALIYIYIYI
eukprot:gene12748-8688_t